jgi:hypothetical protein
MKIIRPIEILDSMLTSSNVAETDYAEWSDVTTYGIGDKVMVLTHTKTATVGSNYLASHRGNFIAGNAFFEADEANLSDYVGTDDGVAEYKIELTDSGGKKATGYVAGGGLGRSLSNNLILDGKFKWHDHDGSTPWTWGAGWTDSDRTALSTNGLLLSQDAGLVVNQLYYAEIKVTAFTSGKVSLFYGSSTNDFYERVSAATFTEYAMTDGVVTFGANGFGASALKIDDLSVQEMLEPVVASSGGIHVVSEMNGTYRDWATVEGGFNPAAIATYTITQEGISYHKCYESLLGSNLNKFPPINLIGDNPYWLELESNNRWQVFDGKINSQTSNSTTIEYVLTPGSFDSIAFFNLDATTIHLVLTDPIAGIIYNKTITLNGITQAVRFDIPSLADPVKLSIGSTFNYGDFANGNAFFWSSLDLSSYAGTDLGSTPYWIELTDNTGKKATGYIGAVGAGETLGSELVTNGDMETGNPPTGFTAWSAPATFEQSSTQKHGGSYSAHIIGTDSRGFYSRNGLKIYRNNYKLSFWYYIISGGLRGIILKSDGTSHLVEIHYSTSGSWQNAEIIATETAASDTYDFGFQTYGSSEFYIDDLSLRQILDPPATGIHIISSFNGLTRNWSSIESGFDPNNIASWKIYTTNLSIAITISKTGTVLCGEIILGLQYDMGTTLYGPKLGITDYSSKTVDDFGNYTLLERAFSFRNTFNLLFSNTVIDAMFEIIAAYRALPLVWADENDLAIMIYGFYKEFALENIDKNWSTATVEIEGLI